MRKIAFFVEGLTERLFLEKLLRAIFAVKHIAIEIGRIRGGTTIPITITTISTPTITSDTKYYILIYSCGGDANVRSYIQDQRQSLINSGYQKVIGIRDVYPALRAEIPMLIAGLYYALPQAQLPIIFILNVMEMEATFLAEHTHFSRINAGINPALIQANLGFHPQNDNMELRNMPSQDLNNSYGLVGDTYVKTDVSIDRTTNALNYAEIYFDTRGRVNSLNLLLNEIDSLF